MRDEQACSEEPLGVTGTAFVFSFRTKRDSEKVGVT
jgi:hypothetical protein